MWFAIWCGGGGGGVFYAQKGFISSKFFFVCSVPH
jgi:hypothetical protein